MNTALVIYDTMGEIISIYYGRTSQPTGVPSVFIDIPDGATLKAIDPVTAEPIWDEPKKTALTELQDQVEALDTKVLANDIDINTRVTMLEEAIVELYELLMEGEENG